MSKFRKKPVVIEAVQFNGINADVISHELGISKLRGKDGKLFIDTLEGTMTADRFDWIIKGISGEFYPCKPDIFEKTYELVQP